MSDVANSYTCSASRNLGSSLISACHSINHLKRFSSHTPLDLCGHPASGVGWDLGSSLVAHPATGRSARFCPLPSANALLVALCFVFYSVSSIDPAAVPALCSATILRLGLLVVGLGEGRSARMLVMFFSNSRTSRMPELFSADGHRRVDVPDCEIPQQQREDRTLFAAM